MALTLPHSPFFCLFGCFNTSSILSSDSAVFWLGARHCKWSARVLNVPNATENKENKFSESTGVVFQGDWRAEMTRVNAEWIKLSTGAYALGRRGDIQRSATHSRFSKKYNLLLCYYFIIFYISGQWRWHQLIPNQSTQSHERFLQRGLYFVHIWIESLLLASQCQPLHLLASARPKRKKKCPSPKSA